MRGPCLEIFSRRRLTLVPGSPRLYNRQPIAFEVEPGSVPNSSHPRTTVGQCLVHHTWAGLLLFDQAFERWGLMFYISK